MSTDHGRSTTTAHGSWVVPGLAGVLGLVMLGIQISRDDLALGLVLMGIMWGYGIVIVLLRRRTEIGELLAGDVTDERRQAIQVAALAVTGQVLIVVLVGGFIVQMARGGDTQPWTSLGALGGATYLVSLVVLRARS